MATMTAQILVGSSHMYHGGITPTHTLYLSENDASAWILSKHELENSQGSFPQKVWLCPPDEDLFSPAILMISVHVVGDRNVQAELESLDIDWRLARLDWYRIGEEKRTQAYALAQKINLSAKLTVSIFRGSSLEQQITNFSQFTGEVEVCVPSFARWLDPFSQNREMKTFGELKYKEL